MAMVMYHPNIVTIEGVQVTDEGRGPISVKRIEKSHIVELASGAKKKYLKGVMYEYEISWENIPAAASDTIDGFGGRDALADVAEMGADLQFDWDDGVVSFSRVVTVMDYEEELVARRQDPSSFRYNVKLTLEQIEF